MKSWTNSTRGRYEGNFIMSVNMGHSACILAVLNRRGKNGNNYREIM